MKQTINPATDTHWFCQINTTGIISLSGADARKLLQGQTTCDFNANQLNEWLMGCICNSKGRVITSFSAIVLDSTILLLLPIEIIDVIVKRLNMYKLRAKVDIETATKRYALFGINSSESSIADFNLPSNQQLSATENNIALNYFSADGMPSRHLLLCASEDADNCTNQLAASGLQNCDSTSWELAEILNGIPSIHTDTSEVFTPQMLNLDQLNAISFTKGCYTGQEVVARTQHLGTLKRRMACMVSDGKLNLSAGTRLYDSEQKEGESAGTVVSSIHDPENNTTLFLAVIALSSRHTEFFYLDNPQSSPAQIHKTFTSEFS